MKKSMDPRKTRREIERLASAKAQARQGELRHIVPNQQEEILRLDQYIGQSSIKSELADVTVKPP